MADIRVNEVQQQIYPGPGFFDEIRDILCQIVADHAKAEAELAENRKKWEAELAAERREREAEQKRREAELAAERREREAEQKRRDAELAAERQKREAELATERREREAEQKKRDAELAAERQKREAELAAERREREAEQKRREADKEKREAELEALRKRTDKIIGDLGNRFGELAEYLVAPNIAEKFNALGYHFTGVLPGGKRINDPDTGDFLAEIDLMLENGDFVVAVEVKTKPVLNDIAEHIERLGVLRDYNDRFKDGRKIRGAIAGAIMPENVRRSIIKAGLYAITQTGDTVKIDVPAGFVPSEW